MDSRIRRIRDAIRKDLPESRLEPLTQKQLTAIKKKHPKVPAHVLQFFKEVGCGSIGPSRYMVYDLIDAAEIFGKGSEAELDGIVLIGDDFAGHHEAYDTKDGWRFGSVGGNGTFDPYGKLYRDFLEFMERWFVEE